MYNHQWLYHETLAPAGRLVKNEREEAALGEGWVDTPAKFGRLTDQPEKPSSLDTIGASSEISSGLSPIPDVPHVPTSDEAADIGRPAEPTPTPAPIKPPVRPRR